MNYSVKRFVKKWADRTYSMQEFENLAHDLTVDSDNRYTQKSALKILVRYAKVDGTHIKLDPESRRFDQSIEKITAAIRAAEKEPGLDGLRGQEGIGAKAYFSIFRAALTRSGISRNARAARRPTPPTPCSAWATAC